MFSLFANKKSALKPVSLPNAVKLEDAVADVLRGMQGVAALPQGYFEKFTLTSFNVTSPWGFGCLGPVAQSPLHRITHAWHSDVPLSIREKLLENELHRQIILHVFQFQTPADLRLGLKTMGSHGYWRPMATAMQYVLDNNLWGASYSIETVGKELRCVYYVPIRGDA